MKTALRHRIRFTVAALGLFGLTPFTFADIVPVSGVISARAEAHNFPDLHHVSAPPDVVLGNPYGSFSHGASANVQFSTASISLNSTRTPTLMTFTLSGFIGSGGPTAIASIAGHIDETFTLTAPADLDMLHQFAGTHFTYAVLLTDSNNQPVDVSGTSPIPAGQYRLRTNNTYPQIEGNAATLSQFVALGIAPIPEPGTAAVMLPLSALAMRRAVRARRVRRA